MRQCKKCRKQIPRQIKINGIVKPVSVRRKKCFDCSPLQKPRTTQKIASPTIKKWREERRQLKQRAVEYKGEKCELCGYSKCLRALKFHHINPEEKDFSLSGNHYLPWETIQRELDKCMLVCGNCHTELHTINSEKKKRILQYIKEEDNEGM